MREKFCVGVCVCVLRERALKFFKFVSIFFLIFFGLKGFCSHINFVTASSVFLRCKFRILFSEHFFPKYLNTF